MKRQNISRRFFIGGSLALGAFGGCRFFRTASAFREGDAPRLRFGVVSDVHIRWGNSETFLHTLESFRDDGVDAVMICGDIADLGYVGDLEAIAVAWEKVFPGNRAPDGRLVEKVFVTGNHDWAGHNYGKAMRNKFPGPGEFEKNILQADIKGKWERIFHEPFSPMYIKDIKGYKFVGAHWVKNDCNGHSENFNDGIRDFYAAHAGEFDPSLPFFHAQHPHPRNTCYGPWAWGRDNGDSTAALSVFPNAIAFSGHSHYPLTDERSIWQGDFTSIGTSSLRYSAAPRSGYPEPGFENGGGSDHLKVMGGEPTWNNGRQGMVVSVYDDAVVIARREYVTDQALGESWVMPLPAAESKPFAFAGRAKSAIAPEFAPGAGVVVTKGKGKTRKTGKLPSVEKETYNLRFPAAVSTAKSRVYEYEFTFIGGGRREVRRMIAPGYHLPLSNKRVSAEVKCSFVAETLPPAPFKVEVRPLSSFHKAGAPIVGGC